jgi:hypothetical protein
LAPGVTISFVFQMIQRPLNQQLHPHRPCG